MLSASRTASNPLLSPSSSLGFCAAASFSSSGPIVSCSVWTLADISSRSRNFFKESQRKLPKAGGKNPIKVSSSILIMGSNAKTLASTRNNVSSSGNQAKRHNPASPSCTTRGPWIKIPPGKRNVHTFIVSPVGRPCHESISSISSIAQPRLPVLGPHVHDVPPQTLCHLKGDTPLKNIGSPGLGGFCSSLSNVGGLSFKVSLDTMVRNNFNACGGQDPGSTPCSHTGAC
mmetsp:Transcript_3237/g.4665  ORF Transcript_3237/g.4665 Transcript_3237/m.4665 type:complete len:230 (+) Transcript_3237:1259-1948(+)